MPLKRYKHDVAILDQLADILMMEFCMHKVYVDDKYNLYKYCVKETWQNSSNLNTQGWSHNDSDMWPSQVSGLLSQHM